MKRENSKTLVLDFYFVGSSKRSILPDFRYFNKVSGLKVAFGDQQI